MFLFGVDDLIFFFPYLTHPPTKTSIPPFAISAKAFDVKCSPKWCGDNENDRNSDKDQYGDDTSWSLRLHHRG